MDFLLRLEFASFIFVLVVNTALGLVVYKNDPKSATNKIFGLLSLFISLWLVVVALEQLGRFAIPYSVWWERLMIFFSVPQTALLYILAINLPYQNFKVNKKIVWLVGISSAFVMILNLTPLVFKNASLIAGQPSVNRGPLFSLFDILDTVFALAAIVTLYVRMKRAAGQEHQQFKLVFIGVLLAAGLLTATLGIAATFFDYTGAFAFAPLMILIFLFLPPSPF